MFSSSNSAVWRGTLGGSDHRNTAKKFGKYRNTAEKNRQIPGTATPQYRVETRCNPEISTLYVKVSANDIEITITSFHINTGTLSQVVFDLD